MKPNEIDEEMFCKDFNTKEQAQSALETIMNALNGDEVETFDWYFQFTPSFEDMYEEGNDFRSDEDVVAREAIKHAELHELMAQIVEKITELNFEIGEIWENEEEHAGAHIARELALHDKKYLPLYVKYIHSNDLNHEVYQTEDITDVIYEWGWCPETYLLFAARWFTPGQYFGTYNDMQEQMKSDEHLDMLFNGIQDFFDNYSQIYSPSDCDDSFKDLMENLLPDNNAKAEEMLARYETYCNND